MELQGFPVTQGCTVFHQHYGYLTVVRVDSTNFYIQPGPSGPLLPVTREGHVSGRRVVFWHNPIIIEPPKSAAVWDLLTTTMRVMATEVEKRVNNGTLK